MEKEIAENMFFFQCVNLKKHDSAVYYITMGSILNPGLETKMCQLDRLHRLKTEIYRIAKKHNAEKVYVFGSCARKEETPESDVDLLVEFNHGATLFDQIDIRDEVQSLLNCKVDVVSKRGLHPYIKRGVLAEAVEL